MLHHRRIKIIYYTAEKRVLRLLMMVSTITLLYPNTAKASSVQKKESQKTLTDALGEASAQVANTTAQLATTLQIVLLVLTAASLVGGWYALKVVPAMAARETKRLKRDIQNDVEIALNEETSKLISLNVLEVSIETKKILALHGKVVGILNRLSIALVNHSIMDSNTSSNLKVVNTFGKVHAYTAVSESLSDLISGKPQESQAAMTVLERYLTDIPDSVHSNIAELLIFLDTSKFFKPSSRSVRARLKILLSSLPDEE